MWAAKRVTNWTFCEGTRHHIKEKLNLSLYDHLCLTIPVNKCSQKRELRGGALLISLPVDLYCPLDIG